LVDDLLHFWHPGVLFSQTAVHTAGCLVQCMLLAVICDLGAIRRVAGFASISADHFCSFCRLPKTERTNFDTMSWKQWTYQEHMSAAVKWRDALSRKSRDVEFEKNQVRWSELLRLLYWDPIKFSMLDVMHNIFLNDIPHHCRTLWGMDSSVAPHKTMKPHTPAKQKEELQKVLDAVVGKHRNKLKEPCHTYLIAFARENSVHIPTNSKSKPTKAEYVEGLIAWVRRSLAIFLITAHSNTSESQI
ncbi:hypothetical protein L208DRAFT_1315437, partial [Tricholoma matsutake]